jgi:hypothetical protein
VDTVVKANHEPGISDEIARNDLIGIFLAPLDKRLIQIASIQTGVDKEGLFDGQLA